MTTWLLFGGLIILLLLNVPIAVSLGMAVTLAMLFGDTTIPLLMIPQRMFTAIDSFPYMAIPFFLFAGNLMCEGGISSRLTNLARNLVGWMPGGLGIVTIISSAFFGALSGSNAATVAAIGGTMIPAMEEDDYPKDYACAVAAASGTLGVVVPPSIPMVTYGIITGVSIGVLFISGIVPALLMVLALGGTIVIQARKLNIPPIKVTLKGILVSFWQAIPALIMPLIILGGIYGGLFTPTEAAAIACLYSLIITMFVFKEINFKDLLRIMYESGKMTAVIFVIIACSSGFVWLLTMNQIPEAIAAGILGISQNPIIILLFVNLLLLLLGVFLETNSIILLVTPMLLPVMAQIGFSPLALGIVMIVNTSVGMITPPMALNIIVASSVGGLPIEAISKRIIPMLLALIGVILLITYVPDLIYLMPRLTGQM